MATRKFKLYCLAFFLPVLVSQSCYLFGQENSSIKGRIIDFSSKGPIPFATIKLKTSLGFSGVISNGDGDFQIPLRYKAEVDTIVISCIGYLTKKILMKQLMDNQLNIVTLKESVVQLSEIIIKGKKGSRITAKTIVEKAIENVPKNYQDIPNSYLAYYRDYQLKESEYINLNEGIVEIFDKGLHTNDQLSTNVVLLDYKQNEDFQRDTTTLIPYDNEEGNKFIPGATLFSFGGNELTILRVHDAIRNYNQFSYSFVNIFSNDFVDNHSFKFGKTINLNEIPLYQISFKSKIEVTGSRHLAKGVILIERGNFAIHKLEYSVFEKTKSDWKLLYAIHLEYSEDESVMKLNYISLSNFFILKNPFDFKVVDILLDRYINAFIIKFNHKPEPKSALNKNNYVFKFDNKLLEIERIEIPYKRESEVIIYLRGNIIPAREDLLKVAKKLKADFGGIQDTEGREVNKITFFHVNQFRELFVQKITKSLLLPDTSFIQRDEPLSKNYKEHKFINRDISNYWMNTPLKRE